LAEKFNLSFANKFTEILQVFLAKFY